MMSDSLIQRQTELPANLVGMCRYLRSKGMSIGLREASEALEALALFPLSSEEQFYDILRATLTRSRKDQALFDEHFPEYWRQISRAVDAKTKDLDEERPKKEPKSEGKPQPPSLQSLKSWLQGNLEQEEEELAVYSSGESLIFKDFSGFGAEETETLQNLLKQMARMLATRYKRRYERSRHQQKLDLRQTLRKNLRRGGELLELSYRKRRIQRLQLVVLCDVSKSMDLYSRFLVQFLYAFQRVYQRIATFVFSTSLHHVSEQLQAESFDSVLEHLSETVPHWSGGTRIGECLQTFLDDYGQRYLNDKTVVLLLSDGWDTGEMDVLESAMQQLQRQAHKVIWLNPLAGNPNFTPDVRAMATAMPYLDGFAAAHSVDSLRQAMGKL